MPYGDSFNVTSSDPLPISNCFIYGVDIVLEVRLLQLLFCCRTLESRSDWSESTTSEARSISSVNHIFDFSLLPRPPAQDTTSKCHPIQPPQTPLSLLRLLIMTARQQQYASHISPTQSLVTNFTILRRFFRTCGATVTHASTHSKNFFSLWCRSANEVLSRMWFPSSGTHGLYIHIFLSFWNYYGT